MSTGTTPSDHELLRLMSDGDEEAFVALYRRHQGRIFRFALLMGGSSATADDVTQEVFLVLLRARHQFDPTRGSLATYLYGIARNHVWRVLERERAYAPLEDAAGDEEETPVRQLAAQDDPLGELTRNEAAAELRHAVLALPARYREVIVLCDFHELSYAETALALDCAVGTVSSRLNRARALLAEKLRASGKLDSTSLNVPQRSCLV
jgi:RNA polymerase sigma-70 factor (ECF subfamily)